MICVSVKLYDIAEHLQRFHFMEITLTDQSVVYYLNLEGMTLLHCIKSVSYTHLDVYKRQVLLQSTNFVRQLVTVDETWVQHYTIFSLPGFFHGVCVIYQDVSFGRL